MILNAHTLGCRQDRASAVELCCVKTHTHVGDKSAEHEHEIGRFDVSSNVFVAAHGAAIDANVKRMIFRNRALAQKISGNRNFHSLRYSHCQTSGAITRQFDSGENNRFLRGTNEAKSLIERRAKRVCVGFLRLRYRNSVHWNFAVNNVVRNLNVDRTLVAQTCLHATDDLGSGALLVEQDSACDCDFVVNAALGFESFNLMVQQRIFFTIFPSRSAAHNHNRRFLSVRASDGVENIESAYAVGYADQTDSVNARISVRRKSRGGL